MSLSVFHLPILQYLTSHDQQRRSLKYADDLLNDHEWSDQMNVWAEDIKNYLDQKIKGSKDVSENPFLRVTIQPETIQQSFRQYQTLMGEFMSHYLYATLSSVIQQEYEHENEGIRHGQMTLQKVDRLPRTLAN